MFDWLKKQFTKNEAPGVQTLADIFSSDVKDVPSQVVPKTIKDYFEPVPTKGQDYTLKDDFRVRDFVRELPGAMGDVAKEIAQGTARSFDYVGRQIAPYLLPGWEDPRGKAPTMEQFLFGGSQKRASNLGGVAQVEFGIDPEKYPAIAPIIGGAMVGLDVVPGGKSTKGWIKELVKSTDPEEIFRILKGVAPEADETALRNVSNVLKDTNTEKGVRDVVNTLVPNKSRTGLPRAQYVQDPATGRMRGSSAQQPLYHGTRDMSWYKAGEEMKPSETGMLGNPGIFFTTDPKAARGWADVGKMRGETVERGVLELGSKSGDTFKLKKISEGDYEKMFYKTMDDLRANPEKYGTDKYGVHESRGWDIVNSKLKDQGYEGVIHPGGNGVLFEGSNVAPRVYADQPIVKSVDVSVDMFRIADDAEFTTALMDVKNGQTSPSKLPILAKKNKDGSYSVLDGRHRLAQAMQRGDTSIQVITDEKAYRALADAEERRINPANYAIAPIAGLEVDEEGNITGFDPVKAGLGMAVVAGVHSARGASEYEKAIAKGRDALTVELSPRRIRRIEQLSMDPQDIERILDAQRRGKIPHAELLNKAAQLDGNFTKLVHMKPGTVVKGEQAEAYKQSVAGYKSYVRKLRENHLAKPQDILIKKQYDDAMATLARAYSNMEAIYSEAGRVVESAKIPAITRSPVVNSNIQKVRRQLPPEAQVKFDLDLEKLNLDDPGEVMDFLTNAQKDDWVRKITEYYRASLLSAVTTNVVNMSGNLLSTIADIPVRFTAGALSRAKSAITGAKREVYMGEAWKLLTEGIRSTTEASTHAFRALLDENYALQFNRSLQEAGSSIPAIKGRTGKVVRLPYRLLSAMDLFFRTVKTNSEAEALIYRKALQEGNRGMDLMARTEELRRTMPTDIVEQVTERADRALYLEELQGFLKDAENLKNRHPWTQMVIPFYRTLVNLMREAYRLTPARFLSKDRWITSKDTRMEEIARAALGTLAGISLTSAIMDGRLEVTGAAPSDSKERDTFYGTGKQAYSIRVGDSWIPYQRVQPFSTILFTASKVADIWNFHKDTGDMDPDEAAKAANLLASEISQFFVSQAPMQGLATFLEFLEGGKYNQGTLPAAKDFFAQMLGGFVPNIIYSGVRASDPTIYVSDGLEGELKKRIPGQQEDLTPRRGALGDVAERPGTPMQRFLNPFNPSKDTNDPVYLELERLGHGVGFPSKQAFKQSITTEQYDLLLQDAGPRTRQGIWNLMNTPQYQNARDDQKIEMIDDLVIRTRRESVAALFPYLRDEQMTVEKLLNIGATPREAYDIARAQGLTEEEAQTVSELLLQQRKDAGTTPPTLQELLAQ